MTFAVVFDMTIAKDSHKKKKISAYNKLFILRLLLVCCALMALVGCLQKLHLNESHCVNVTMTFFVASKKKTIPQMRGKAIIKS